jgi:3-oxoacyl-[acyl-carrier-protein] synthase II
LGTSTRTERPHQPVTLPRLASSSSSLATRSVVSSTKGATGHTLGAAGAVETIFTVLALHHGLLPPTINQIVPDPDCDLDYIPNAARVEQVDVALSNSFGFGGHNSVVAFRRWPSN